MALYPHFIIGIGGSAGGLKAYTAFLNAMPSDTGAAFVIVSHMLPNASSLLAEILSKHTKMTVMIPCTGMPIQRNHVYVIPPNADLLIDGYTFEVISPRSKGNVQVDLLFASLAEAMGARSIGIILSGRDGDGTNGCKHIKAKGGITFTQDESADAEEMSRHAQAAGCIDFVLSPEKIAHALQSLIRDA